MLPHKVRALFEIVMQRMLGAESFGLQHHVKLQQTLSLCVVPHQKPQICGKTHAVRITAGQARFHEIPRRSISVIVIGDEHRQQVLLIADIVQQPRLTHTNLIGDVLQRRAIEALLPYQFDRRRNDFGLTLLRRFANTFLPRTSHASQSTDQHPPHGQHGPVRRHAHHGVSFS